MLSFSICSLEASDFGTASVERTLNFTNGDIYQARSTSADLHALTNPFLTVLAL